MSAEREQEVLAAWRAREGTASATADDPWGCGLIGVEWSEITTTLGELGSKRTACDPAWAVQFSRWFRQSGLERGDPVAIYSSASFPGLLVSAIAAAADYWFGGRVVGSAVGLALGAIPFLPWAPAELVVPAVVVGKDERGRAWVTTIDGADRFAGP